MLDGIEVIFTTWNSTDSVWTLNPLVPNQGGYDSDGDGVGDLVELNLTSNLPINGETYPLGVPTFGDEARKSITWPSKIEFLGFYSVKREGLT